MTAQEKTQELLNLLIEAEKLDAKLKEAHKEISAKTVELAETMEEQNVSKIEIDGIVFKPAVEENFTLKVEGKTTWDSFPKWFEWLEENGEGGLIQTKKTVPWNTRKAFLKRWTADGNDLPDFIEQKYFQTVKYNKSAIKRLANDGE